MRARWCVPPVMVGFDDLIFHCPQICNGGEGYRSHPRFTSTFDKRRVNTLRHPQRLIQSGDVLTLGGDVLTRAVGSFTDLLLIPHEECAFTREPVRGWRRAAFSRLNAVPPLGRWG